MFLGAGKEYVPEPYLTIQLPVTRWTSSPFVMLLDLSEKLSFVFCYGPLLSFCSLDLSHEFDLPYETGMLTPQSLSAASASLVTSIQVVTLQPVPPGYVTPQGVTPVTSYLTLSSTETITETRTETQTLALSTESASAGAYTGLASKGWNSSISTFITVKSTGIGSVTAAEKYHPGMAYPLAPSGIVPFTPGNATRHIKARDVMDIVVATIDGVPVSWTNNYDGTSLSSSDASPIVVPVTATALQPEAETSRKFTRLLTGHQLTFLPATSSSVPSPVQTGWSSLTAPVTAIGNFTSNVLPTPFGTSTSSSSVAQLTTSHALSPLLDPNTAASSTAATATASSCADASAEFLIDFDDLPAFSAGPGVLALRALLF